jgi:hypothetical protein
MSTMKKIAVLVAALSLTLSACGGGGGGGASAGGGSTTQSGQVLVGLTDGPGDFARYAVKVVAVKLRQKATGALVDALPPADATVVDFTQLTSVTEFLTAGNVALGVYDQVVMTLDYSAADIEVYDGSGNVVAIPAANITDDDGNPIASTIALTVRLDSDLAVVPGGPVHLALDFNLGSTNQVTIPASGAPTLVVSPVLAADLLPDTDKIQRFRGPLQGVNVALNSLVMILRPFANTLSTDGSFGTMTVLVNSSTVYNIDGTNYAGTAGLTALGSEPRSTAVVAHGTFDSSFNFTATEILAGSSVPGGTLDFASGTTLGRSGNTLILKGATVTRATGAVIFSPTLTVTLTPTTKVSRQFSRSDFSVSDISVGQRLAVTGSYDAGTASLNAANGQARLYLTSIVGTLNFPPPTVAENANGWLSMAIQRIDGIDIVDATHPFNFSGTGTNSFNDASIADYSIKPAPVLDISPFIVNHMPLRMKGFANAFGAVPEAFNSQAITDLSTVKAFLNVGWGTGRLESAVFTALPIPSTGITLNAATMASVGVFHRVNRDGDVTDFVIDHPGTNPFVQMTGSGSDRFFILQGSALTPYPIYAEFVNALNLACLGGARVRHLYGWGIYDDGSVTFTAGRLLVVLTN